MIFRQYLRNRVGRAASRSAGLALLLAGLLLSGLALAQAQPDAHAVYTGGHLMGPQVVAGLGFRSIRVANESETKVTFDAYRLQRGVELSQFTAAVDALRVARSEGQDSSAALTKLADLADALGGVAVSAHSTADLFVDLTQGEYAITATPTATADTVAIDSFHATVGGDSATAPQVADVVKLTDTAIDVPATVNSGKNLWKVQNSGQQLHMTQFYRLLPGRTVADLTAYLSGNSANAAKPYDKTASFEPVSAGVTAYMNLDLAAGDWVAACLVKDSANPTLAHFQQGMIDEFIVN